MEKNTMEKTGTFFGVPAEKADTLRRVMELNAVYGFDEADLGTVDDLVTQNHMPLKEAFAFVEELKLQLDSGEPVLHDLNDLARISHGCHVSLCEAEDLMWMLESCGMPELKDVPRGFFDIWFSERNEREGYTVAEILQILKTMEELGYEPWTFDDKMEYALYHEDDPIETIRCWEEDYEQEKQAIADMDILGDAEYNQSQQPGIWELSDEEYEKY